MSSRREVLRFGRRVTLKVKGEKVDEFISAMRRKVYPTLRREKGLRRIYLLQPEEKPGEFESLTLWSNERDAEDYGRERYAKNLDAIREFLAEEPASVTNLKVETHAVGEMFKKASSSSSSSKKKEKKKRRRR
jgi:quinol monooxygenase YgiN